MGSWCHLRLTETNMSVSRVKKWLTNNVPQILTPLTGMSFPGLHDSCDRVIVFVTRKSGVDLGFSLGGGAPLTD